MNKQEIELMVTLWPSFPHFPRFSVDNRLAGIRLNSAMMSNPELDEELKTIKSLGISKPLYFDVKGRQLRIAKVNHNPNYLDIELNHPIFVNTPTPVLFKAGADHALLDRVEEDGKRLIFLGGPKYLVRAGESLHIRDTSLVIGGSLFTEQELIKIDKVARAGFDRYFLSYVEEQSDIDQFQELVGKDCLIYLKIESKRGLEFVAKKFKKTDNLVLVAARGDLYVEIDRPHEILAALKLIISKDPEAQIGSRMLLSVIHEPVPSAADFLELAWMYDIGYRRFMLCDEICLKGDLLNVAVNAFESFRNNYPVRTSFLEKIRSRFR